MECLVLLQDLEAAENEGQNDGFECGTNVASFLVVQGADDFGDATGCRLFCRFRSGHGDKAPARFAESAVRLIKSELAKVFKEEEVSQFPD